MPSRAKKTRRLAKRAPPRSAFKPGQSGNPAGRPPGSRNRATVFAQELMEKDIEAIVRKVVDAAVSGNLPAAKLVIERLVPPMRERPISVALPEDVSTAAGVNEAAAAVLRAACSGDLLPGEAQTLAAILETRRRTIETDELERRIAALETRK